MAISDKIDRMTAGVNRAADALVRLNDEIDRAASTEFTTPPTSVSAPASFSPPLAPGAPGSPSNPLPSSPFSPPRIFGPDGRTISTGGGGRSSSPGGPSSGPQFRLADNALIPSMDGTGPLMRRSDLNGFLASGICEIMLLPSGGEVVSCPWGLYPGTNGVLSTVSGRSGGGAAAEDGTGGRAGFDRTGNQDRSRRLNPNVTNNPTGRQFGGSSASAASSASTSGPAPSSVSLDSRPITDRLDGLRRDVQTLASSLAGDGGAAVRFRGGL